MYVSQSLRYSVKTAKRYDSSKFCNVW